MLSFETLLGLFLLLVFLALTLLWRTRNKYKLPKATIQKNIGKILDTKSLDPSHGLIQSHKIFVATLGANRKTKAVDAVKRYAAKFPNAERVWFFHRLRNKAAHQVDLTVSKTQSDEARSTFVRALKSISK